MGSTQQWTRDEFDRDSRRLPKDTQKAGVILEFKAADRTESLAKQADEALRQIQDRQYEVEFAKREIVSVWKYGIAFCGKQVCVKMI